VERRDVHPTRRCMRPRTRSIERKSNVLVCVQRRSK
jgi:hypothetical protein